MEKVPKIGESLERDIATPEFQKKELQPETSEDIEEKEPESDGESLEIKTGSKSVEVPTEIKNTVPEKTWFELIMDAKREFSEEVQILLDKRLRKEPFSSKERSKFDRAINNWWWERFGMQFFKRNKGVIKNGETQKNKKEKTQEKLEVEKINRVGQLHRVLKNLDDGEPVDEFRDETRRVVGYDEESGKYFIDINGEKKYLGMGDIISDYAWGIKYVPDGAMEEPAYRTLAKRILVNETRRDLEVINDVELVGAGAVKNHLPIDIEKRVLTEEGEKRTKAINRLSGFIAEAMARELLTRASINNDLDFAILRASLVEDYDYKYDFKLRLKKKLRGVKIEDGREVENSVRKVGIQFTTGEITRRKLFQIEKGKQALKKFAGLKILPVDEILLLRMPIYKEVVKIYQDWLEVGKPSGGPERFLSRDLKIRLLKEVTKGLVEISDEDIEKIFPLAN